LAALLDAERENTALRAEVERLSGEVSLLQQEARIRRHISEGFAAEAEAERAAVVAWLQRMAGNARHWGGEDNERAEIYDRLVDVFECGEHRREEQEPLRGGEREETP
jgi:hypothetical protein